MTDLILKEMKSQVRDMPRDVSKEAAAAQLKEISGFWKNVLGEARKNGFWKKIQR